MQAVERAAARLRGPVVAARMTNLRYNPRLDGLRCLAVFGVLPVHFVPASWFLQYADTGNLGVKLFFVLSGYLITAILLDQRERVESGRSSLRPALAAFYARRFLRLTPVYFAYLVAALVLVPGFAPYAGWYFAYLQNFLFAAQPEVFAKYLAHFWTLAIEEQFYLLMPALLLAVPRRHVLTLVLGLLAAGGLFRAAGVALGYGEFALKMMMPAQLDTLALGALLAVLRWSGREAAVAALVRAGWLFGLPLVILCHAAQALGLPHWLVFVLEDFALGLLFAALVGGASAASVPRGYRFLEWAPLVFLGRISYGIYVYHFNVPGLLRDVLLPRLGLALPESDPMRFALYACVSVAIAAASFYAYERHFNRLKDRLGAGAAAPARQGPDQAGAAAYAKP